MSQNAELFFSSDSEPFSLQRFQCSNARLTSLIRNSCHYRAQINFTASTLQGSIFWHTLTSAPVLKMRNNFLLVIFLKKNIPFSKLDIPTVDSYYCGFYSIAGMVFQNLLAPYFINEK